jgi:hypothetical protein
MSTMKLVKPSSTEEKRTRTTMDTVELTPKLVASWKSPPFQRDLKINAKVLACAEEIKMAGGVLPGVVTVGVLDGDVYIVDGQHRLAAWLSTTLPLGYADVRTHWFTTMGEMAAEFVRLNSQLVRLRPDDILRGLEPANVALQRIRRKCGYIGYDLVRRGANAPMLSMSVFLRVWVSTKTDVPRPSLSNLAALSEMDEAETTQAIEFIGMCFEAWRRDTEYARLWGSLNLTLCGWLYRRLVLGEKVTSNSRVERFSKQEFSKCLLALSAEAQYLDYLVGRNLGERDRAPAYGRVKTIFQRRFLAETGRSAKLPQPAWAHAS